jgi:hypothetical protein
MKHKHKWKRVTPKTRDREVLRCTYGAETVADDRYQCCGAPAMVECDGGCCYDGGGCVRCAKHDPKRTAKKGAKP